MYYGPHGPTGHGSGAPMIEACAFLPLSHLPPPVPFFCPGISVVAHASPLSTSPDTRCFLQILRKIQTENITTMTIKPKAVDDFNEHRELYLKRTAWSGQCSSWFKPGPDGTSAPLSPFLPNSTLTLAVHPLRQSQPPQ